MCFYFLHFLFVPRSALAPCSDSVCILWLCIVSMPPAVLANAARLAFVSCLASVGHRTFHSPTRISYLLVNNNFAAPLWFPSAQTLVICLLQQLQAGVSCAESLGLLNKCVWVGRPAGRRGSNQAVLRNIEADSWVTGKNPLVFVFHPLIAISLFAGNLI